MILLEHFSRRGTWCCFDENELSLSRTTQQSSPTSVTHMGFYDSVLTTSGRKEWAIWSIMHETKLLINGVTYGFNETLIQFTNGWVFDTLTVSLAGGGDKVKIKLPRTFLLKPRYWVDFLLNDVEPKSEWYFPAYIADV
jgi:hypothetical protein